MAWKEVLSGVLILSGAIFMALGALGLLRLPDLYLRMSASSKAATLGAALALAGGALHFNEFEVWSRAAAATFFLFLTAPAAAHLIGRAGYIEGVALFGRTHTDELAGRYCKDSKVLRSEPDPSEAPDPNEAPDSSEAPGAGRGSGSAD